MLRIFNWFRNFLRGTRAVNFLTSVAFRGFDETKQLKHPQPKINLLSNYAIFSVSSFAKELNGKKFVLANILNDTIQINNGLNYLWKRELDTTKSGGKRAAGECWPKIGLLVAEGVIENNPFKPIEVVLVAYDTGFQLETTHEENQHVVLKCDERSGYFSVFDLETKIKEAAKQKEMLIYKNKMLAGLKQ